MITRTLTLPSAPWLFLGPAPPLSSLDAYSRACSLGPPWVLSFPGATSPLSCSRPAPPCDGVFRSASLRVPLPLCRLALAFRLRSSLHVSRLGPFSSACAPSSAGPLRFPFRTPSSACYCFDCSTFGPLAAPASLPWLFRQRCLVFHLASLARSLVSFGPRVRGLKP